MTTQVNLYETLAATQEQQSATNGVQGDTNVAPTSTHTQEKSIPTDYIRRDGNYSKEEMLALFKPDYKLPDDFVFHPMVMVKEALQPVAFTPDEGRFSGKQVSAFQRGARGGRGLSTRGGRGGPPRGRGGRGGKLEGHGESKFSAFGREGDVPNWRDKRRERGEDEDEDEEYEGHEEGSLDRSVELSESNDEDWDEVKKKKKKKKELDGSIEMKLRYSQEAAKGPKEEVKKEVAAETKPAAVESKPVVSVQPQQSAAEKSVATPAPKPNEGVQPAPQLTLAAVQNALKQQLEGTTWIYKDAQGIDHGPYPSNKMNEWIIHDFLRADLILRKATDNKWVYLGELILMEQRNPFTGQSLAEWVQSGAIPVLLHYQLLQLHQVLVQQQQQQHLPMNLQQPQAVPFNYPGTQQVNPSLDNKQPTAAALLQQLQHLAQQTSPAQQPQQQAGWPVNQGWGSPSPQRTQPVYPASPQPAPQVQAEAGLTRKQGVFKIEDLEGKAAPAAKPQKKEESPFGDLWGLNFGSLEKSGNNNTKASADDSTWETNKPKSKKTHNTQPQVQSPQPTQPKRQAQAPQVQPQSPPPQPVVSSVPAPWANASQSKGVPIKSIQEDDYKDYLSRQQREQQEFEERFKQQQALQQKLNTPWGAATNAAPSSGSSLSKIQEEEMRRKQEEMRRKERERAGIVEEPKPSNWAAKQKPVAKGKPNMREILEEEQRERERQKSEQQYAQPQAAQPKGFGAWATPEKSNMSVREILEEEERVQQLESKKKTQPAPQPQPAATTWVNKNEPKKQSNFAARSDDVPLREVQQQEFKHQQKQTPQKGGKKTVSLTSIQQEQLKQKQAQSRNAPPVQANSAWKTGGNQAVSMRDILRQEEAQKRATNTNQPAEDDDENFWDYNPNQEQAKAAPVVSPDEFPALSSTVKKDDKIKQALGAKQQQQQRGKKKGQRSVDPKLLGFAAPQNEDE